MLHGKTRRGGLVFDIADLIKDAVILPQAFISAMRGDDEQGFREACIESLVQAEALDFMIDTVKAIALAAQITELSIESIYGVALAKYALRALPGNVKDDAAERLAAKAVLGIEMHTQIREDGPAEER